MFYHYETEFGYDTICDTNYYSNIFLKDIINLHWCWSYDPKFMLVVIAYEYWVLIMLVIHTPYHSFFLLLQYCLFI